MVPAQAGVELFAYCFASAPGVANVMLLSVADAPVIFERQSEMRLVGTGHWPVPAGDSPGGTEKGPARKNDVLSQITTSAIPVGGSPTGTGGSPVPPRVQKISLPCEIAGQFRGRADRDWFTFDAKKGQAYWIEVVSHRLGLPTDPLVVIQRISGDRANDVLELNDSEANIGGAEFNTTHRDPSGKFDVKEDGTYRLLIRDLFAQARPDPRLVYHLSIRKVAPDFRLATLPQAPPAKKDAKDIFVAPLALRRGETVAAKVLAWRRDGFDGEIAVTADELPTGVRAAPCRIESGKNSALLFLTGAEDATISSGTVIVHGSAAIGDTNVSRTATPATLIWGTADPANEAAVARVAATSTLSLAEDAMPVRVHAASNVIETVAGKTVKINFLIDRQKSFSGTVKLKPVGLAALDLPDVDVDAKATNLVLQIDLREKKVPVGTHVFALQGSAQGKTTSDDKKKSKDTALTFYSAPIVLRVNPAPPAQTNSPAK